MAVGPHKGPIQAHLEELDYQHKWRSGHHLQYHKEDVEIPQVKGIKGEF